MLTRLLLLLTLSLPATVFGQADDADVVDTVIYRRVSVAKGQRYLLKPNWFVTTAYTKRHDSLCNILLEKTGMCSVQDVSPEPNVIACRKNNQVADWLNPRKRFMQLDYIIATNQDIVLYIEEWVMKAQKPAQTVAF